MTLNEAREAIGRVLSRWHNHDEENWIAMVEHGPVDEILGALDIVRPPGHLTKEPVVIFPKPVYLSADLQAHMKRISCPVCFEIHGDHHPSCPENSAVLSREQSGPE